MIDSCLLEKIGASVDLLLKQHPSYKECVYLLVSQKNSYILNLQMEHSVNELKNTFLNNIKNFFIPSKNIQYFFDPYLFIQYSTLTSDDFIDRNKAWFSIKQVHYELLRHNVITHSSRTKIVVIYNKKTNKTFDEKTSKIVIQIFNSNQYGVLNLNDNCNTINLQLTKEQLNQLSTLANTIESYKIVIECNDKTYEVLKIDIPKPTQKKTFKEIRKAIYYGILGIITIAAFYYFYNYSGSIK